MNWIQKKLIWLANLFGPKRWCQVCGEVMFWGRVFPPWRDGDQPVVGTDRWRCWRCEK